MVIKNTSLPRLPTRESFPLVPASCLAHIIAHSLWKGVLHVVVGSSELLGWHVVPSSHNNHNFLFKYIKFREFAPASHSYIYDEIFIVLSSFTALERSLDEYLTHITCSSYKKNIGDHGLH